MRLRLRMNRLSPVISLLFYGRTTCIIIIISYLLLICTAPTGLKPLQHMCMYVAFLLYSYSEIRGMKLEIHTCLVDLFLLWTKGLTL